MLPKYPEWNTIIPGIDFRNFGKKPDTGDTTKETTQGVDTTTKKGNGTTKAGTAASKTTKAAGGGTGAGGADGNSFGPAPNADANFRNGDTRCRNVQPGNSKELIHQEDRSNGMGPWVGDEDPEGPGWCGGQLVYGQPLGSKAYSVYNQCCKVGSLEGHLGCASGCCFDGGCKAAEHCRWSGTHYYDVNGKRIDWTPPPWAPQGPDIGKPCKRRGKLSSECWFGWCGSDGKCTANEHWRQKPATWAACWKHNNDSAEKYARFKERG